jgi:polyisoprenoid-binding protein YceI
MRKYLALFCVGMSASILAAPINFDFKDPKGVNTILFKTDAPLESINGTATGIIGTVSYDPSDPGATKGKIIVAANSLHVGSPMQKEHLHGDKWLDVAKYPQISYDVTGLKNVKIENNVTTADATGTFSLHGVSKQITVPVKLTYLKDKLKARTPGTEGDLLVIRSNFTIKRGDFGINKGVFEDKVSDDIELTLSLAGAAPKAS